MVKGSRKRRYSLPTIIEQIKPKSKNLVPDVIAGFTNAVVNIPDSIAAAVLAGVNPTYAFNAIMVGTPVGALFTSSEFMSLGPTSAMMITVGTALAAYSGETALTALVTLTILVGLFMLIMGLLKLGSITRFISNSVMVGFLTGLAVLIILGQMGDLSGFFSDASGALPKTLDLLRHPTEIDPQTTAIGLMTLLIIILLGRTKARNFSLVLALVVTSALVVLLGWDSVEVVGDLGDISGGLPDLALPDLSLVLALIPPALAVGMIALIQAAGVSQGVPNPNGSYPDASGDFRGQGIANTVTGFLSGLPVGGSLGGTGVVIGAGARSRWANIFTGVFFAILILLFGNLVELAAMPAVAAILIYVGYEIIDPVEIMQVWDTSWTARLVMIFTFLVTLVLSIQAAVLSAVVLSFLFHVISSASNVRVVELVQDEQGDFEVQDPPEELPDHKTTLLTFRGGRFFAAAYKMGDLLPSAIKAQGAVAIIRLRGKDSIGSTFIQIMERYSAALHKNGGKLMFSGVSENVYDQLEKTEMIELLGEENVFPDSSKLLYSSKQALKAANAWLEENLENN
jgi:SulP family sulfate permease